MDSGDEDLGDVEPPELEEIEDISARKPVKKTAFKSRKMMGNTSYRGGDRIRPVNFCFTIVTAVMILLPSLAALTVV